MPYLSSMPSPRPLSSPPVEQWSISADGTNAVVTGRVPPVPDCWYWFLLNDEDRTAPDWYLPTSSPTVRAIMWWLRNPAANFFEYVIGVRGYNYTIRGTPTVTNATRYDEVPPQYGWHWSLITLAPPAIFRVPLPLLSYSGRKWLWYVGWRAKGGFGIKINRHTS